MLHEISFIVETVTETPTLSVADKINYRKRQHEEELKDRIFEDINFTERAADMPGHKIFTMKVAACPAAKYFHHKKMLIDYLKQINLDKFQMHEVHKIFAELEKP